MTQDVIEGVYLSSTLDLKSYLAKYFEPHNAVIRLRTPDEIDDPSKVQFALTWHPEDDAFDHYPNLKLSHSIAAGVDSIVACPSLRDDIYVCRVHDENQADLMAAFAAWNVVHQYRDMGIYLQNQSKGIWESQILDELPMPQDYTVGILGYGWMGKAMARAITAMGFSVVAAVRNQPTEPAIAGVSFEVGNDAILKTARRSQALINVLPLTDETIGFLNAALFARMPKGARLIQLGRGQHLIDEDLRDALDSGHLGGASLDVFAIEPLPEDHFWWQHPRVVITPHQASISSRRVLAEQVVRAAQAVSKGLAPDLFVDRSKGY
ncbi:MAG: hydroxyacid dehydrogenase [Rhodobacteraceae bacterium]|nr:hydroxyacid dehydrogenase [Paracoccaceae bacterium]